MNQTPVSTRSKPGVGGHLSASGLLAVRAPGRPRDERASEAIIVATLRQLDALGYGQVSMESVASEAGVSRATIYRRYQDKADLVTAAIASVAVDEPSVDETLDARTALIRCLEQFDGRFAESCLEVIGGLVGARTEPHAMVLHRQRIVRPRSAYVLSLLRAAQQEGLLDHNADLQLALQMLVGSVLFRRVSGETADSDWAAHAIDAILGGMGMNRR